MTATGYIFDSATGENIAWIAENGDVYSTKVEKPKIARLSGGDLHSLDGQFLGAHVEESGKVQSGARTADVELFTKLAKGG